MCKQANPFSYVNRHGKEVDLSDMVGKLSGSMTKQHVAHLAKNKHAVHALAHGIDVLKAAGYSRRDIMSMADWILSGRSLSGIS